MYSSGASANLMLNIITSRPKYLQRKLDVHVTLPDACENVEQAKKRWRGTVKRLISYDENRSRQGEKSDDLARQESHVLTVPTI